MTSPRTFITVTLIFLLVGIGFSVYVWYVFQSAHRPAEPVPEPEAAPSVTAQEQGSTPQDSVPAAPSVPPPAEVAPPQSPEAPPVPTVISVEDLTAEQQAALKVFGVERGSFTLTPDMISCAQNAVGEERLAEIVAGSAPGPLEALKLAKCFKK